MFGYEDISLNFAFPIIFMAAALLLLAAYTIYVYRFTIPSISKAGKASLIILRTLALLTIITVFFEPVISFTKKNVIEPVNLVYIDNSSSINIDDGTNRAATIKSIVLNISSNNMTGNSEFFLFGNGVRSLSMDSIDKNNFTDGTTNLAEIFSSLDVVKYDYSSITIISDGVFTEGSNPVYKATNLPVPVFTIGIGDTTQHKDVEISKILFNNYVYAETPTSIVATVQNKGFSGETITASLFENNKLIEEQKFSLNKTGIQNINFNYVPEVSGEQKLSVHISTLSNEQTTANNKKLFYINVLSNKIKVLLLAGNPSTDLSFIINTLKRDENLLINSITQISSNKFVEEINYSLVDSADILFLVGFPAANTPQALIDAVKTNISDKKKPYLISLTSHSNVEMLKLLQPELPFSFNQHIETYRQVQPEINLTEKNNPILSNDNSEWISNWNNLPPVLQPSANFDTKPGSKIISTIKINNIAVNIPLIVTRNFNGKKSVAVLATDLWKWKLQTAQKNLYLFDSFFLNCVKWLNTADKQEKFSVKTSKRSYSSGEIVEFLARVSDESLNPVDDAEIKVKISTEENSYEIDMQNEGKGLYEGKFQITETGDFNFRAEIYRDDALLGTDNGSFNVGEIEIELINPVMNYPLLNLLANVTNGKYYSSENYNELFKEVEKINKTASKEKLITSDLTLWTSEWLLLIAVLLFSLEWFLRKRMGML